MARRTRPKIDPEERRENVLRPCRYLGYNWDHLGLYFIDRGAYELAEAQLRRAVWLNPYEPDFKLHLGGCLYREERYNEARQWVLQVIESAPERPDAKHLLQLIDGRIADANAAPPSGGAPAPQEG